MVAYSFKKQFAEPIIAGTKRQTIRGDRKRHARPGETLQLYTGMRTRQCRKIGEAVCVEADNITLLLARNRVVIGRSNAAILFNPCDLRDFARRDGFETWQALKDFWRDVHDEEEHCSGILIRWHRFKAP